MTRWHPTTRAPALAAARGGLAVVVPLTAAPRDLARLRATLGRWNTPDFAPCRLDDRATPAAAHVRRDCGFAPEKRALHDTLAAIAARHDADVGALAVAWLMAHPARIMPVMGTNNLQRIAQIGKAAELAIDRETWFEIYTAAIGQEVP